VSKVIAVRLEPVRSFATRDPAQTAPRYPSGSFVCLRMAGNGFEEIRAAKGQQDGRTHGRDGRRPRDVAQMRDLAEAVAAARWVCEGVRRVG
jgi:hypothetical protein